MNETGQKVVAALLLLVGLAVIGLGVVYSTTSAASLPSFMPGRSSYYERQHNKELRAQTKYNNVAKEGQKMEFKDGKVYIGDKLATTCAFSSDCSLIKDRTLTKRGIGLIVLGLLSFVGAWYSSGMRKRPDGDLGTVA